MVSTEIQTNLSLKALRFRRPMMKNQEVDASMDHFEPSNYDYFDDADIGPMRSVQMSA